MTKRRGGGTRAEFVEVRLKPGGRSLRGGSAVEEGYRFSIDSQGG